MTRRPAPRPQAGTGQAGDRERAAVHVDERVVFRCQRLVEIGVRIEVDVEQQRLGAPRLAAAGQ